MYVYIQKADKRFQVGFFMQGGSFHKESEHTSSEAAACRVNFLNGGSGRPVRKDKPKSTSIIDDDPESGVDLSTV